MEKLKSININTVFDKKTVKDHLNKPLVNVSGFAYAEFEVPTKYGPMVGFKGDFVCVNLLTGEVSESDAAFLPKGLTKELQKKLANGSEISFAADIQAMETDKNAYGYAWVAEMPRTEEMQNRREKLKAEALKYASTIKALPKPSAEKVKKSA